MTAISRFDAPKPKRRAKAFALAILPLALALTACGGGSSDDSKTPPPAGSGGGGGGMPPGGGGGGGGMPPGGGGGSGGGGDDTTPPVSGNYQNPGTGTSPGNTDPDTPAGIGYHTYSGILQDLANSDMPIYQVLDNGWSFNPFQRVTALVELKKFYDNTIKGTPGTKLTTPELKEYEELIATVYRFAQSRYNAKVTGSGILSDLSDYLADDIKADIDAGPHTSNYIRDNLAGASTETVEDALLDALGVSTSSTVLSKYSTWNGTDGVNGNEFGSANLQLLRTYDDDDKNDLAKRKELMNMLVGFVNPSSGRPAAQLSFYHANTPDGTGNTNALSVGADLMHMEDVSFFLYYYADTSSDPTSTSSRSARVKGTPSMSKDEFMDKLNDKATSWSVSGTVVGTGDTTNYAAALPVTGTGNGDLTYRGYMLAGTIPTRNGKDEHIQTHIGNAEIILDHMLNGTASSYNVDITFSNIVPMDGEAGTPGMIKFMNQEFTGTTDSAFGTAATATNDGGILGRFYGTRTGDNDLADNYGGRDAVGGTFTSTLGEWDGNDQKKGKNEGPMYYGVFGAQQTTP